MDTSAHLVLDGLWVAGFGIQHSALAMLRTKRLVKRQTGIEPLAWRSAESLCNVVYILIAASFWYHSQDAVWHFSGMAAAAVYAAASLSWLWYWELHLYEYDCGLAFGSTTLVAQLAGAPGPKLVPWKVGSRRWIRFPVHTAFFGMFFFMPTMTPDLLVLAVVLNVYNLIGSVLYDRRLVALAGDSYRSYQSVTGLIWPPVYRAPGGARDLVMPAPSHWRKPAINLPGLPVGIALGCFYAVTIGLAEATPLTMLRVGAVGLAGAILAGLALGRILKPDARDWAQQQTDLSTAVALAAATGVVTWVSIEWLRTGHAPVFATFLPLWFTVQYLGHVFAFVAHRKKWTASLRPESSLHTVVAAGEPSEPAGAAPAAVFATSVTKGAGLDS